MNILLKDCVTGESVGQLNLPAAPVEGNLVQHAGKNHSVQGVCFKSNGDVMVSVAQNVALPTAFR